MSLVKYGDAETISVIQPVDLADEETKSKLDVLKEEIDASKCDVNQEVK